MRRFYFFLARELGIPVGEMLHRMTSQEITEWIAFYRLEAEARQRVEMDNRAKVGLKQARRLR